MTMGILALILTTGALALRNYWLNQSLDGSRDEVITQLRRAQEAAVSQSHPLLFAVRFTPGSSQWDRVQYNPTTDSCTVQEELSFPAGVVVNSVDFAETAPATPNCRTQIGTPNDEFAFFFPRGTATAGSVTLRQPALDREFSISVSAITGRVDEQ